MGLLIGMDEAGYGPNLGPLVVTVTVWEVPGSPRDSRPAWAQSGPYWRGIGQHAARVRLPHPQAATASSSAKRKYRLRSFGLAEFDGIGHDLIVASGGV